MRLDDEIGNILRPILNEVMEDHKNEIAEDYRKMKGLIDVRDGVNFVDDYNTRLNSITNALNELSKHFIVEIRRSDSKEDRSTYYQEIDCLIDKTLRELYKDINQVIFK